MTFRYFKTRWLLCFAAVTAVVGCGRQAAGGGDQQCTVAPAARTYDIPRFAVDSPFEKDYQSPEPEKGKQLWARSYLWEKPPELIVEKWLTEKPETEGKYVMIEFWATWCRQCRLAVDRLNELHRRFGDRLVIIAISDEDEATVRKFAGARIKYNLALDSRRRTHDAIGVFGIPHAIVLEPDGYVVWEGFPLLEGHELTARTVQAILDAGAQTGSGKP